MASTVVKVQCDDGEIYRLTLQEEPSFEAIVTLVANCRPDAKASILSEGGTSSLKYEDDEGDLCTLAPATFADFLSLQTRSNQRLLKLKLKLPGKSQASADERTSEEPQKPETPPQGPPPGLEKEDTSECGPGAWGRGGNGGGPRRLLGTLRMLREAGMLTPAMFASLAVQWLPLLTQRVARKVDKINHMARDGLDQTMTKMLEIIQEQAAETPGLEQYSTQIGEALGGGSGQRRLGEAILEMLKSLRTLGFEVQTNFCESIASSLLPYLENLTCQWFGDSCGSSGCMSWQQHPGSTCNGCGAAPIVGPRFRCSACAYDLCGNCYPQKNQLHGNCAGCRKDFLCVISPGKEGKAKSRGCDREKGDCTFDWKGGGKGGGFMEAAMGLALAHQLSSGVLGFPPALHGCPMPFGGMDMGTFDEGQDASCWMKGKGRGKGKKGKWWWKGHGKFDGCKAEEPESEFEKKVASLLELRLANEEVIRELLVTHGGDASQVTKLLTS